MYKYRIRSKDITLVPMQDENSASVYGLKATNRASVGFSQGAESTYELEPSAGGESDRVEQEVLDAVWDEGADGSRGLQFNGLANDGEPAGTQKLKKDQKKRMRKDLQVSSLPVDRDFKIERRFVRVSRVNLDGRPEARREYNA